MSMVELVNETERNYWAQNNKTIQTNLTLATKHYTPHRMKKKSRIWIFATNKKSFEFAFLFFFLIVWHFHYSRKILVAAHSIFFFFFNHLLIDIHLIICSTIQLRDNNCLTQCVISLRSILNMILHRSNWLFVSIIIVLFIIKKEKNIIQSTLSTPSTICHNEIKRTKKLIINFNIFFSIHSLFSIFYLLNLQVLSWKPKKQQFHS